MTRGQVSNYEAGGEYFLKNRRRSKPEAGDEFGRVRLSCYVRGV